MKRQSQPFSAEKINELAGEIMSDEFVEMWAEYVQMRNRVAKTRIETDRSQQRIFRQLLNFSKCNLKRLYSLEQSTDFKWRAFFSPKNDYLTQYKRAKYKEDVQSAEIHKKQELNKPKSEVVIETKKEVQTPKFSVRDKVRERAKKGCTYSIALVRKWDNPDMAKAMKEHEKELHRLEIKKKVREDERKGLKFSF